MGHIEHAPPRLPHSAFVLPPRQVPVVSQQPWQLPGLQPLEPPAPPLPPPVPVMPPSPATHMPLEHASFGAHDVHSFAPTPQANLSLPGWHMPLTSQQPLQLDLRQRGVGELHAPMATSTRRVTKRMSCFTVSTVPADGPFGRVMDYHRPGFGFKCALRSSISIRRSSR